MRKSLITLIHKLPSIQQIAGVYAIIVILLYAWTFSWWLWKLNSWLFFLSTVEIASILAYALATNFLESLFVLFVLLALCMILPRKLLRDAFVVRASIGVSLLFGYLMIYSYAFKSIEPKDYPQTLADLAPFVLLAILLITYFVPRLRLLTRMIESFVERAQIFLYLSVPASIVSLFIVILRNLVIGWGHG